MDKIIPVYNVNWSEDNRGVGWEPHHYSSIYLKDKSIHQRTIYCLSRQIFLELLCKWNGQDFGSWQYWES